MGRAWVDGPTNASTPWKTGEDSNANLFDSTSEESDDQEWIDNDP